MPAEIPAWPRLLDRWTPDGLPPAPGSAAAEVITELRRQARAARRAFCHGDFYLGNLLFAGEVLTGIVDWERAKVMPPGNEVARFRMDLAIHPGGDAPGVFLTACLQETPAPAVEDLALWDVLAGAVRLAGAEHSRRGLEQLGVLLDTATQWPAGLPASLRTRWPDADTTVAAERGAGRESQAERSPGDHSAARPRDRHAPDQSGSRRPELANGRSARHGDHASYPVKPRRFGGLRDLVG